MRAQYFLTLVGCCELLSLDAAAERTARVAWIEAAMRVASEEAPRLPSPIPHPWVKSNLSHERVEAVPEPNVPGLLLGSLGHNPEQQEPGNASVGVLVLERLAVGVRFKRERQGAIRTCPQRHVAGVGVRQGALDQLTRHVGPLSRIWAHADIDRCADQFVRWAAP